jgi:hypothetical protein
VADDEDAEGCVFFPDVLYRWRCNEQRQLTYGPSSRTTWFDPEDCDDTDDWLSNFDFNPDSGGDGDAAWFNSGSA